MQAVKHNWPVKAASLALAIVVHFYVRSEQNNTLVRFPLPVTVQPPTGQRAVEPSPSFRVNVEIEGPGDIVRRILAEEIHLEYDLGSVKPGKHVEVPFTVTLPDRIRDKVQVDWRPRTIPVKLLAEAVRQLPVVVRPTNRPPGWEMREPLTPNPSTVTVTGSDDAVNQVATVVATMPLEETPRINALVTLQALDLNGRNLSEQVRLDPVQVTVTGIQQRVVLQKRVPVQPNFRVPAGMRVAGVEVNPPRARVIGPEAEIGDVFVVETEPLAIPPGRTQIVLDAPLHPPRPGLQVVPTSIQVSLKFQPVPSRK